MTGAGAPPEPRRDPARALARLNVLPPEIAEAELLGCCGSRAWAREMVAARPFRDLESLRERADAAWWALAPADWLEAFRAHPRIGERAAATPQDARAAGWSRSEQSGMDSADDAVRRELAQANAVYEARFGHIFIVCATGLGAAEMLDILRRRLGNDPATELRVAAEEQRRITRLRLERLVGTGDG